MSCFRNHVNMSEAHGKTIYTNLFSCGQLLILYADNTYTRLVAESNYDDDLSLDDLPWTLDDNEFAHEQLVACGFITQAELDELIAEKDRKWEENSTAEERQIYERLHKKYGRGGAV